MGKPIVRVALDTDSINDMPKLKQAMKKLHQADPGVEVMIQSTGELVLVGAGEVINMISSRFSFISCL